MEKRSSSRTAAKLSSFAVATLWHRRLDRTRCTVKVQPRVAAELTLHPVVTPRAPSEGARVSAKDRLDVSNAA